MDWIAGMSHQDTRPALPARRFEQGASAPTVAALFATLLGYARGVPGSDIEVRQLETGPGRDSEPSTPGVVMAMADRALEFHCNLPEMLRPAQVLLLELDTDGQVWLLSPAGLLDGDVWYHRHVVIPRPDTLPTAGRPPTRGQLGRT